MELPQHIALLPLGSWQWKSRAYTSLGRRGQWAVELLQCYAAVGGGGGALGSRTPRAHYATAFGPWPMEVV